VSYLEERPGGNEFLSSNACLSELLSLGHCYRVKSPSAGKTLLILDYEWDIMEHIRYTVNKSRTDPSIMKIDSMTMSAIMKNFDTFECNSLEKYYMLSNKVQDLFHGLGVSVPKKMVVSPQARFNLAFGFIQDLDECTRRVLLFKILEHDQYKPSIQDVTRITNLIGSLVHGLKLDFDRSFTLLRLLELLRGATESKVHAFAVLEAGLISHGKQLREMLETNESMGEIFGEVLLEALESAIGIISTVE
jgi:hypothetical protein